MGCGTWVWVVVRGLWAVVRGVWVVVRGVLVVVRGIRVEVHGVWVALRSGMVEGGDYSRGARNHRGVQCIAGESGV